MLGILPASTTRHPHRRLDLNGVSIDWDHETMMIPIEGLHEIFQNMTRFSVPFLIGTLMSIGCSPTPFNVVSGGTAGSLVAGDVPLPDFEVKVHDATDLNLLGFATTGSDGRFQLVQSKGDSPLVLTPGNYVVTLASIGPAAPRISQAYTNASKSSLKVTWKPEDKSLDLKIPAIK